MIFTCLHGALMAKRCRYVHWSLTDGLPVALSLSVGLPALALALARGDDGAQPAHHHPADPFALEGLAGAGLRVEALAVHLAVLEHAAVDVAGLMMAAVVAVGTAATAEEQNAEAVLFAVFEGTLVAIAVASEVDADLHAVLGPGADEAVALPLVADAPHAHARAVEVVVAELALVPPTVGPRVLEVDENDE